MTPEEIAAKIREWKELCSDATDDLEDPQCRHCGDRRSVDAEPLCDQCARLALEELASAVPALLAELARARELRDSANAIAEAWRVECEKWTREWSARFGFLAEKHPRDSIESIDEVAAMFGAEQLAKLQAVAEAAKVIVDDVIYGKPCRMGGIILKQMLAALAEKEKPDA